MKKANKNSQKALMANARAEAIKILSDLQIRMQIASSLGKTFGGKRDLYQNLGYTKTPQFEDYLNLYLRQDIVKAIIDAPVDACWQNIPQIVESADEDTEFEKAWEALVKKRRIWHYFSRVDRIASIGHYGVLFLGFDDGAGFSREVKSARQLMYLAVRSEQNASISQSETSPKNERYGQPIIYSISMKGLGQTEGTLNKPTHWTRVIHIAEDPLEDDTIGTSRLEVVLNRLQDLEKVVGGSGEMFWQGAFPGYGLNVAPDATIGPQDKEDLELEVETYVHKLKRYMRLRGVTVQSLEQQVADPSSHVSVIIDLIAAAVRIPKRILLGSERGELASSQDEKNWMNRIDQRRKNHCEPMIIRPFIDRLIKTRVLPEPKEDYTVDWSDLMSPSEKDIAETGEIRSRSLANYVNAIGADSIIPQDIFMGEMLGFTKEQINKIEKKLGKEQEDEK